MKEISITIEETGEEWELMSLIQHLATQDYDGDTMHPDLDELWNLYSYA
jgi:hypothetical protein